MNNFEMMCLKVGLNDIKRRVNSPLEYDQITCEMIDTLFEFVKEQVKNEKKNNDELDDLYDELNKKMNENYSLKKELEEMEAHTQELELLIENLRLDNEVLLERTYQYELNNEREIENEDIWHLL